LVRNGFFAGNDLRRPDLTRLLKTVSYTELRYLSHTRYDRGTDGRLGKACAGGQGYSTGGRLEHFSYYCDLEGLTKCGHSGRNGTFRSVSPITRTGKNALVPPSHVSQCLLP
jgi:hypothetical protein